MPSPSPARAPLPIDSATIRALAAKRLADRGATAAANELGVSTEVLYRLVASGSVRRGSLAQIALALGLRATPPAFGV